MKLKCHSLERHSSDFCIRYFCEWFHVSVVWCVRVCVFLSICLSVRAHFFLSYYSFSVCRHHTHTHTHSLGRCNKYLLLIDHSHFCVVYQHSMTLFVLTVLTTQELWIEWVHKYGARATSKGKGISIIWARVYLSTDVCTTLNDMLVYLPWINICQFIERYPTEQIANGYVHYTHKPLHKNYKTIL